MVFRLLVPLKRGAYCVVWDLTRCYKGFRPAGAAERGLMCVVVPVNAAGMGLVAFRECWSAGIMITSLVLGVSWEYIGAWGRAVSKGRWLLA